MSVKNRRSFNLDMTRGVENLRSSRCVNFVRSPISVGSVADTVLAPTKGQTDRSNCEVHIPIVLRKTA